MAALAVTVLVVAACLPPPGTVFRTTLVSIDQAFPLPVALGDETGLVTGIEQVEADPIGLEAVVKPDPDDPNAFIVAWLGGACDSDATITFKPTTTGYALHLEVHDKLGFGCMALGVLRGLRVTTSEPIPLDSITASGNG